MTYTLLGNLILALVALGVVAYAISLPLRVISHEAAHKERFANWTAAPVAEGPLAGADNDRCLASP